MNISSILKELQENNIVLSVKNNNLVLNGPTQSLSDQLLTQIRTHKKVLVELLKDSVAYEKAPWDNIPLTPLPAGQERPLSFAQQRLWIINQYEGGTDTSYNVPNIVQMNGNLNIDLLKKSVQELVARHDILRTHFVLSGSNPVQCVSKALLLSIPVIDVTDNTIELYIDEHLDFVFNLSEGPLIRVAILRRHADEHYFLLNMHHIISDGWSLGVLFNELSAIYSAYLNGSNDSLKPLTVQYADYASWQRQWLTDSLLAKQFSYWKKQLSELPALLMLPTDRPRLKVMSHRGARKHFLVPLAVIEKLNDISHKQGATLFMALLTAFSLLLSRYSGQKDIAIGTPISGRRNETIEDLIGFFVNTLVLRNIIDNDLSFIEQLSNTKRMTLGAYNNQDVPFDYIVEHMNVERSTSYNPFFQVMFALQNMPLDNVKFPGLVLSQGVQNVKTTLFDLSAYCFETPSGLAGILEYNVDLFEEVTAEKMINNFIFLLEKIADKPTKRIGYYDFCSKAEKNQQLQVWNHAEPKVCEAKVVHKLFEHQALLHPEAVALQLGKKTLSYGELNRQSQSVANYLLLNGLNAEARIGICIERSFEMVIAILAVVKAGATYVPLDPAYPEQRLQHIIDDSQMTMILCDESSQHAMQVHDRLFVNIKELLKQSSDIYLDQQMTALTADNALYLIYTSGSTGAAKGVVVTHRTLSNLIDWHRDQNTESEKAVTLQYSALSFDVSAQEIFLTLASGGSLVLINEDDRRDPDRLINIIHTHNVERCFFPFVAYQMLMLELVQLGRYLEMVRQIFVAGEQLRLHDKLVEAMCFTPNCCVYNHYGPTETHVVSSYRLPYDHNKLALLTPIGNPLRGCTMYILNEYLTLLPSGTEGEIYIGGCHLARGYFNRVALTAQVFIPDPFSNIHSARLYRTGDLGRYLPDGSIQYRGRNDQQVKVNGYRIECTEIEKLLSQHQSVVDALVLSSNTTCGGSQLIAYLECIASEVEQQPLSIDLKDKLKQHLPHYMIPAQLVFLPQFPLTPSGKVDIKALSTVSLKGLETECYRAPQSEEEFYLDKLWCDVLGVEQVGRTGNFFCLGGHSLSAVRLISRIRADLNIELSVKILFENPILKDLACIVLKQKKVFDEKSIKKIDRAPGAFFPLADSQQRLWFLQDLEGPSATYNMYSAYKINGYIDVNALCHAFFNLVERHEILRTSYHELSTKIMQKIIDEYEFDLNLIDVELDTVDSYLHQLANHTFNLYNAPLLKVDLLRVNKCQHIMVINIHHIACDGWSLEILLRELNSLYTGYSQNADIALPELTLQFSDYACWRREQLETQQFHDQLQYWSRQLEHAPESVDLPLSYSRPEVHSHKGRFTHFVVPSDIYQRLTDFSRERNVTLYITLLASFYVLLHRYSGAKDIVVGTPTAGRSRKDIEDIVGNFSNMLAIREKVLPRQPFSSLLRQFRLTMLDAYDHQDLPFDKVIEHLGIQRSLNRHPLFQTVFQLLSEHVTNLSLSGTDITPINIKHEVAKFDLTVILNETQAGLVGCVESATDLFDVSTINRLIAHYSNILRHIIKQPECLVGDIPILSDFELNQLLVQWNKTQLSCPATDNLLTGFSQLAVSQPNANALIVGDKILSYAELDEAATQLAYYLYEQGKVGAEVRVGVCMHRTVELVVAMLGILKSGSAYVPLDPQYPKQRINDLCQDSQLDLVITQESLKGIFDAENITLLLLDKLWGQVHKAEPVALALINPDSLAYLIYTSGSTGKPKGVAITHRNSVSLLHWAASVYGSKGGETILAAASVCFDLSIYEIFYPLNFGHRVVLVNDMVSAEQEIVNNQVSIISMVPSAMEAILRQGRIADCVHTVNLAGEALSRNLVDQVYSNNSVERVYNQYGPSEDTTFSLVKLLARCDKRRPTIGKPIANTQIYLLDAFLSPVPVGVAGELYLCSMGVARGYLDRPGLSAEKFIPNPYASVPGARLYRTGDICRYRENGDVEYLGRADHQVKIRGFRIEIGEIEHVIASHIEVQEVLVLVKEEKALEKQLIAYIVPSKTVAADSLDEKKLRMHLRDSIVKKLPSYMVPLAFVIVEAMPLSPNGKIDRKRLLAENLAVVSAEVFQAPVTPTETALAICWVDILGIPLERLSVEDNFFDLGGHSLLGTHMLSFIMDNFGLRLSVKDIFLHPTIREFSQKLDNLLLTQSMTIDIASQQTGIALADTEVFEL